MYRTSYLWSQISDSNRETIRVQLEVSVGRPYACPEIHISVLVFDSRAWSYVVQELAEEARGRSTGGAGALLELLVTTRV